MAFLSTPSARRATGGRREVALNVCISIHALREEGDLQGAGGLATCPAFLSTPSARRATSAHQDRIPYHRYFYPRPPRGGRLPGSIKYLYSSVISIHALREEGDDFLIMRSIIAKIFLSTPSARRATSSFSLRPHLSENFYPRPPRGGRPQKQRENPLLLSHYTPLCTNCKEVPVKQTAKSHRYLRKRLVFRCEASGKTMCAACSHWRGIKRSAHYPAQTPGAAQHARP